MMRSRRFADRTDAGEQLATALDEQGIRPDIVLAIPRGALPIGREVADAFDVPLDVIVASKIGAPGNPELAIGAVASDGSVWRNQRAFAGTGASEAYFERERSREVEIARDKTERYRGGTEAGLDVAGKTVVVVDDGVATGSTARACLKMLQDTGAAHVVLAIPVGPPETVRELERLADEVVCLATPSRFMAVGQYYDRFEQVSDEKAMTYLSN